MIYLAFGRYLPESDPLSPSLITNAEAIAVNQHSSNNHQVHRDEESAIWIAGDLEPGGRYLALFNTADTPKDIHFEYSQERLSGPYAIRDIWNRRDRGEFTDHFHATIQPHGAGLYSLTSS